MSGTTQGVVQVILSAKDKDLAANMKKAADSIMSFGSMMKAAGAAVIAAFTTSSIASGLQGTIDKVRELGRQSEILGVSVEKYQAMQAAISETGARAEKFQTSMTTLMKNMENALNGSEEALVMFKRAGIDLSAIWDLPLDEKLASIAGSLSRVKEGTERTATAMKLFGESGRDLVPFFNQGADAVQRMIRNAEGLPNLVKAEDVQAMKQASIEIDRMSRAWENLKTQAAVSIAPAMSSVMESISQTVDEMKRRNDEAKIDAEMRKTIARIEAEAAEQHMQEFIEKWIGGKEKVKEQQQQITQDTDKFLKDMKSLYETFTGQTKTDPQEALLADMEKNLGRQKSVAAARVKINQQIIDANTLLDQAISDDRAYRRRIEAEQDLARYQKESWAASAGNFAAATDEMAKQSTEAFWANKALRIAESTINAWAAYSNTLASPFAASNPLTAQVLAASQLAAGMAAAAQIAAARPPGRAAGGPVGKGGLYEVAERGPELLTIGDRSFLMMGGKDGKVDPAGRGPNTGGPRITVNVHNAPGTSATVTSGGTDQDPTLDIVIERIDQAMAAGVRRGDSALARAGSDVFGWNRSRGAR